MCFFLSFFVKKCENHTFSRVFDAAGPRFRACFFVVSARSLFENLPKTTRFYTFFAFLWLRRESFVFNLRFFSLFLAFFEMLRKPRVFTRFLRFGCECDAFFGLPESSGNSFSAFRFQKRRVLPRFSRFSGHAKLLPAAPKMFKTTRFHAFFAIFGSCRICVFSYRFL